MNTAAESSVRPSDDSGARSFRPATKPALSDRLPRPWMFPLAAFAGSWVIIVTSWNVANAIYGYRRPWDRYFWYDDSGFYGALARLGYHMATPGVPHADPGRAAFFPLYPAAIRLMMDITGTGVIMAGLITQIMIGAASAVAVWALASHVYGHRVADRAVLLYCAFPGAMTLGMLYSEPLGAALAAACLLAALRRKWILAGLLALLASAEHSTLIVLAPVLGAVAVHAIWTRRDWHSLFAAALAPLGMLAFFAYVGQLFRDYFFWFRIERAGWHMHTDFGAHELAMITWSDPLEARYPFIYGVLAAMFWIAVLGIALLIAARGPWPVTVYTALVLLSCCISPVDVKPRFALTMTGVFLGYAAKLPTWLYWPVLAASAALMAFLAGYWPHHLMTGFPAP